MATTTKGIENEENGKSKIMLCKWLIKRNIKKKHQT